jgi:hypothetical protein
MSYAKATAVLVLAGLTGIAQAAAPNFKEGQWETSYSMEVVGMPFKMPPITARNNVCLDQQNYVPDASQPGQECKVSNTRVNKDTVSWTLTCRSPQGTVNAEGRITYKGDRYDGSMDARLVSEGSSAQPIQYKYTMEGKRLGPCK